jgi:MFS family permease
MSNTNDKCIFWASFLTLIAAGIGFSVRGAILGDWGRQFGFTQSELGEITGGGLAGFGVTIITLSFFADRLLQGTARAIFIFIGLALVAVGFFGHQQLIDWPVPIPAMAVMIYGAALVLLTIFSNYLGYGTLMLLAFLLHASSAVVTFAATPVYEAGGILGMDGRTSAYWCLNIGMWLFALGNGTCEAVINPLTATLFPTNKTHWLNILHAGWPGGLVLGALCTFGFNLYATPENPIRWEYKLGVFVIPVVLYGLLMLGRRFPTSEATASGVSLGAMVLTLLSPILIFLFLLHAMVGYVELGTDSWITNITETVLANQNLALIAFIWTNVLMFTLRFFAGPIVHKISPLGLLFFSAMLGTAGLVLMGQPWTNSIVLWIAVVTVYGIGKTFYWPTMLGVISERYPKGGALALGICGGVGMISAGLLGGPGIGYKQDFFATTKLQETSMPTYERYRAEKAKDFPIVSPLVRQVTGTDYLPAIAGIDNAKAGVLDNFARIQKEDQEKDTLTEEQRRLNIDKDLDLLRKAGNAAAVENLERLRSWWVEIAKAHADLDKPKLDEARLFGGKQAMLYTAAVPAAMAIGYLLLILVFKAMGGYRQVHLGEGAPPRH